MSLPELESAGPSSAIDRPTAFLRLVRRFLEDVSQRPMLNVHHQLFDASLSELVQADQRAALAVAARQSAFAAFVKLVTASRRRPGLQYLDDLVSEYHNQL